MIPRIIVDEAGAALHVLRPGEPPEIFPLALDALSQLARDSAAALDDVVRGRRRRFRKVERIASEPPGVPMIGRLGE